MDTCSAKRLVVAAACGALVAAVAIAGIIAHQRRSFVGRDHDLVLSSSRVPTAFPLSVSPGQRYLRDAQGKPFLLHGDTAWSLLADLSREEVDVYLADRRARGFNTIVVNLLEHRFARKAPANVYGDQPFSQPGRFDLPNEAYFAQADWVLSRARDLGFLVLLTPAYTGWHGEEEGWWKEMVAAGGEALYAYGKFLGARYQHFDNIVWLDGGDYDPPDKDLVRQIIRGIKEVAPGQLHSVHPAPETAAADFWSSEPWLDLIPVYTYRSVCQGVRRALTDKQMRPVFLLESTYENEHGGSGAVVRSQAYEALLCGAAGTIYGNNPIWHFNHPGIYKAQGNWWKNLGSPGAQSMTHLYNLFSGLSWWELHPDEQGVLVHGKDAGAVAASTRDGALTVIYVSGRRSVELDLSGLLDLAVDASWFDPASGAEVDVAGSPLARKKQVLRTPGSNAGGDDDWVLVLGNPTD
ncbi:DUF4038 domain-containing protein [Povalibacter sp.]|uniref:apiosidase-like domain-containing protein n=1 Tax=Povalibacter sp. TaxID=1962978 RepID=UPI002F407078